MKSKLLRSGQQGFSLVELLVVIAVIAIIAAIAIPNIANITRQADDAKARRNAQNIASVASAARAAGATQALHTKATVIGLLEGGITARGMSFGISPMEAAEETAALRFLNDNTDTAGAVLYSTTEASGS